MTATPAHSYQNVGSIDPLPLNKRRGSSSPEENRTSVAQSESKGKGQSSSFTYSLRAGANSFLSMEDDRRTWQVQESPDTHFQSVDIMSSDEEEGWSTDDSEWSVSSGVFSAVVKQRGYLEQLLEHVASLETPDYCECEFCFLDRCSGHCQ